MAQRARTGVTAYTTPNDHEVLITRVVDAPRHVVFDAWANPKHVPKWMLGPEGWSMPVCEIELRPGGSWRYVWRRADGTEMGMSGSYREIVPPQRLVWTESWGAQWPETTNALVLSESGGQTTMALTVTYPSKQARDAALQTGMKEGLDQGYARLDQLLKVLG